MTESKRIIMSVSPDIYQQIMTICKQMGLKPSELLKVWAHEKLTLLAK
jgi:hypothetical protein